MRAHSLSALRRTHLLGSDTSKACLSFPPPGQWPPQGGALASLTSHSHTWHPAPGTISVFQFHIQPSQCVSQATSFAFPLPSPPLFWCFPEALKKAMAIQRAHLLGQRPCQRASGQAACGHVYIHQLGRGPSAEGISVPAFPGTEQGLNEVQLALWGLLH